MKLDGHLEGTFARYQLGYDNQRAELVKIDPSSMPFKENLTIQEACTRNGSSE